MANDHKMKAFRGEPSIFTSTRPEESQAELKVKDLTLKFGGITALNKIDLSVHDGELISIIGPNGAGKTSLLNCISGGMAHYKVKFQAVAVFLLIRKSRSKCNEDPVFSETDAGEQTEILPGSIQRA